MTPERAVGCRLAAAASHFLVLAGGDDDAEDFFLAHDDELVAVERDLGSGVFAEEDAVAGFYVEREGLAFVVGLALADGDHFAFLRLFLGGVGDDDSAANRFGFLNTLDQNAVMQGGQFR